MAEEKLDLVSREQALRVARMLGCQGAHEAEKGWMPCGSHEEYEAIKKGKEEYLKVLAAKKKKPLPKMVQRTKRLETKSDAYYENRADAVAISKARGCGGVRTVLLAGKKYYAVCNHKAPKRGWENLDEKPISGIATLPGGGLVTGSFSGKSLGSTVGEIASGKTPIDGDGDGFISRGGKDNVPAPVQKIVDAISSIRNAFKKGEKPADRFPIPDDWFKSPADAKRARETYPDMHMRYEEVFGMRRYVPATGLLKDDADGYDKFNDPNRAGVFVWRKYWMPSLTSSKSTVGDALRRWRGSFGDSRAFASALAGLDVAEQFKKDQDFLKKVEVLRAALADAPPMGMKTYRTMRLTPDVGESAKVGSEFKFSAAAVGNEKVALMYENDEIGQAIKGADKMLVEFPADASGIFHDEQGNSRMGYPMVQGGDIAPQEGIISGRFRVAKIKKQTFTNPYSGKKITRNVHVLETIKSKTTIEEKGFVNFVSRSTDPDTFSDPESARIRARNIGCIGIRRYTARDGKLVWMPCTNVSDYNRVTGIRGDNSPRNNPRRQGSKFGKKSLGTPIGAKPSEENVDGDGDGFTTGGIVGGEDKIPVVPTQILEHAGSLFLKNFEKQKSDLEKKFGDLRNVKNATKAFKKTFPRLKSFDLFDEEGENFSSEYTFARAITLLHLAQDKRIADTISDIGFIDGNDSKFKNTTALCAIGLIDKTEKVFISHAIHFNKSLKSTPQSGGGRVYNGWGDEIVKQMREKKVPQSEIDKFWSMYVVNHEWTHAEHNVAMFEQHNLKLDAEVYDMARFAFPNLSDDQFNARVKTAVELARKENGQNWGLLVSDDERRQQVFENMVIDNIRQLESQLAKGYRNDLQKGEVSQLGGNYPLTVSGYAAETFNELVAEKGSAYRMGHSAGNPNNPAWRKLLKFVRGGVGVENDIPNREGMSRQERRALERAQAKLKKSLEDLPFGIDWGKVKPVSLQSLPKKNGFISIFGQCEGFTYYLKDVQDGGESKTKTLGDPIGGSVASSGNKPIDGDGDGFIASTPGGVDDTRVSPKQEKRPKGEITKGNIDLNNRPVVKNRDGSISTVRSITITEGNTAVVIPTVIKRPNGSGVIVNDQEAIKYYQRSGQHLGKFSNIRDADTYAQNLHNQQAVQYPNSGKSLGTPIGVKPSEENVDGDGDGLTTGGIVGGKDKIPVAPKIIKDAVNKIIKAKTEAGLHAQRILNTAVFDPKDYEPEIVRNTFRPQQLKDGTYFDYAFGADPAKWVPLLEQFKKENPMYLTGFDKNGIPVFTETLIRYKDLEPKIHPDKPHRLWSRQRIKAKNIVDTSPKNDSEVMDRGLYLWERNGITKQPTGDDPNFCSILGWCATSILGIAEGWEKPDQTYRGKKEVPHSDLLWLARNLLTGIAKSKPQPTLWRGIAGTHQDKRVQKAVGSLKAGDTFDIGLGSTSRDVNIALKYNGWFAKEELMLRIQAGSKGVKIPRGLSQFPEDQEVLTSGRFEVKSIEKVQIGNNELNLKLEEKKLNDIKILLKDEENLSALLEYQQRQIDKIKSPQKPFFITIIDVVQKEILYGA